MPVKYVGPRSLRSRVVRACERNSEDYLRNNLSVTVGIPILASTPFSLKQYGFESQRQFDQYVDQRVRQISQSVSRLRKSQNMEENSRRLDTALEDMRRVNFIAKMKGAERIAYYAPFEDLMCLDADVTVRMILYETGVLAPRNPVQGTIDDLISHERVHYDLGLCLPSTKKRELYLAAGEVLRETIRLLNTTEDPEIFIQSQIGFQEETRRLKRLIDEVTRKEERLRIDVAEEALAYNISGGKDNYKFWLRKVRGIFWIKKSLRLFDQFGREIESGGLRQTIERVKEAEDSSFNEDRDAVDFLLE